MALQRIGTAGLNFTVSLFNGNCSLIENTEIYVVGVGVKSGLLPSIVSGLILAISDGILSSTTTTTLASIPNWNAPPNTNCYVWINEYMTIQQTSTYVPPDPTYACLCYITTNGTNITNIYYDGRMDFPCTLQQAGQVSGYSSIAVTGGTLLLLPSQYVNRVLEFTGVLTSNETLLIPNNAGDEWTVINSTTGAYTLTIKTQAGTGVTVTQGKTKKVFCDGTNIRNASAEF